MARILVCDDDESVLTLLDVALEHGHEVVTTSNGHEALETLATGGPFDAAVLDVMLPEIDGFEAVRRIRRDPATRELPVILLTARVTEDDHVAGFTAGADAYLTKPFDPEVLEDLIDDVLERTPEQRRETRESELAKASLLRFIDRRVE